MYFFDPERGRRRRAMVRDAAIRYTNELSETAESARRKIADRLQGVKSKTRSTFSTSEQPASEEQARWSPATRALVGGGALALLTRAVPRSGVRGAIVGAITTALAGRALKTSPSSHSEDENDRVTNRTSRPRRDSNKSASYWKGESSTMRVSDIMTSSPATCTPNTPLREVAALMVKHDCGSIPVVEPGSNRPVGIITDRDITVRAIADGKNPQQLSTRDCMTSPIESIQCSASLDECTNRMEASQIRRMIVVDDENKICGIVAQADIAMYAPQEETAEMVQEVSTPAPVPTI